MRSEDENISRLFKKSLPSAQQEEAAGKRVFYRLLLKQTENQKSSLPDDEAHSPVRKWRTFSMAAAAAVMVASFLFALTFTKSSAPAGESTPGGESARAELPETRAVVPPPQRPATGAPVVPAARVAPAQSAAPAGAQSPPEPLSLVVSGLPNSGGRPAPPTAEAEQAMRQALTSSETTTGLSLAAEADYFQLNRAEYSVPLTLKIPVSDLAGIENAKHISLDIRGTAKDSYGTTVINLRDAVDVPLSDEMAKEIAMRQIVYETRFTLLPGSYSIKFLVHDRNTGRIGTYPMDLVIPNLSKMANDPAISSVVLGSELVAANNGSSNSTQPDNALFIDGKKLIPSLTRTFSKGRDMIVIFQAYEPNAAATEPLTASVAFYRGDTRVFESSPVTVKDDLGGRLKTLPVRLRVPLSSLPVGAYECQVTVLNPATQKSSVWRAPITVVN